MSQQSPWGGAPQSPNGQGPYGQNGGRPQGPSGPGGPFGGGQPPIAPGPGFGSPQGPGPSAPGGWPQGRPGSSPVPSQGSGGSPFGGPNGPGMPGGPVGQPVPGGAVGPSMAPGAGAQLARPRRSGGRLGLWLGVGIPVTALLFGGGGYLLGQFNGSELDASSVQTEVARVLKNDFGLADLESVSCPSHVKNEQGASFQCTFDYAGRGQSVTVTVTSHDGQIVVGKPE